jgi:hypothetical protein
MRPAHVSFCPWFSLARLRTAFSARVRFGRRSRGSDCPKPRSQVLTSGADWHSAIVPELRAAEELLDRLEASGFAEREFKILGDSTFEVRWR